LSRSTTEFISDMTPEDLRKNSDKIFKGLAIIPFLAIFLIVFIFVIIIELTIAKRPGIGILAVTILFLFTFLVIAVVSIVNKASKLPADHPFNSVILTDEELIIKRRLLYNDVPTLIRIPITNIGSINEGVDAYVKEQREKDGIGYNLKKSALWIPKGGLWIGQAPSSYHLLVKLRIPQEILVLQHDLKLNKTTPRIDLTDIVLISVRPSQQPDLFRRWNEVRRPTPSGSLVDDAIEKIDPDALNSIDQVTKDFPTSVNRKDVISHSSTYVAWMFLFTSIITVITFIFLLFARNPDYPLDDSYDVCMGAGFVTFLIFFMAIMFLSLVFRSFNIKKLQKVNVVKVGEIYIELVNCNSSGSSFKVTTRFPRNIVKIARRFKDTDIRDYRRNTINNRIMGISDHCNISHHHPFAQKENLIYLKFNEKIRVFTDHYKGKWYQSNFQTIWTDELVIDIPKEKHDEFIDLVFS